jgi:hypothetical protein
MHTECTSSVTAMQRQKKRKSHWRGQLVDRFLGSVDCEKTGTVVLEGSFMRIEGCLVMRKHSVRNFENLMVERWTNTCHSKGSKMFWQKTPLYRVHVKKLVVLVSYPSMSTVVFSSDCPLSYAIHHKTLVPIKSYHVVITTNIPVNRTARRLERNIGKYTGGGACNNFRRLSGRGV